MPPMCPNQVEVDEVLIVEPGAFRTSFAGGAMRSMSVIAAYQEVVGRANAMPPVEIRLSSWDRQSMYQALAAAMEDCKTKAP
jgi:hypothetical protein